jgi:hypothetical protein
VTGVSAKNAAGKPMAKIQADLGWPNVDFNVSTETDAHTQHVWITDTKGVRRGYELTLFYLSDEKDGYTGIVGELKEI